MSEVVKVAAKDVRAGDFLTNGEIVVVVVKAVHWEDEGKVCFKFSNGSSEWQKIVSENAVYSKDVSG